MNKYIHGIIIEYDPYRQYSGMVTPHTVGDLHGAELFGATTLYDKYGYELQLAFDNRENNCLHPPSNRHIRQLTPIFVDDMACTQ